MTTAHVFVYLRPDGVYGAVADAQQRLIVTAYPPLAQAFAAVLERRLRLPVTAIERNPLQVAELVVSQHVGVIDIRPYVEFIESDACSDIEDAMWRAVDMANAVPADTIGDWHAAHADRPKRVPT